MRDPKHQQTERKPAAEMPKPKKSIKDNSAASDPPPGQTLEGEGSPGLSILGGGGHA
jgi:hypothetical protein